MHDLIGRMQHKDVREATIARTCKRYGVDRAHATRVEETALAALDQVAADWQLGDSWTGRMLSWAARLHEMGLAISHTGYHKHGAYVVTHSDLAGFSRDDQLALGALIRAHRRKIPPSLLVGLSADRAAQVRRLVVLLRLAVDLHRGRSSAALPPPAHSSKPGSTRAPGAGRVARAPSPHAGRARARGGAHRSARHRALD